jgi:hypothetical protein
MIDWSCRCRSPRKRNAAITGAASFPVLDGYGDSGLSVLDLGCQGSLSVPTFANFVWNTDFTITACVGVGWGKGEGGGGQAPADVCPSFSCVSASRPLLLPWCLALLLCTDFSSVSWRVTTRP